MQWIYFEEYNKLKRIDISEEKMLEPFQIPVMTGDTYLTFSKPFL